MRCRPEQAELVLAELTVLAPGGVEETSGDGYIEYAIYGAEGELPDLGEEEAVIAGGTVEVEATEVADDWADRWRAFHKPLMIEGPAPRRPAIWLRPPWEPEREGEFEVVIDPGQAFGTGAHPTTRLCIEALIGIASDGGPFGALTDLGCGSGVLAIAAGKLGWGPLGGCDHEVAAVDAARENARANGVEVRFDRIDLKAGLPELAPTTVANLTAPRCWRWSPPDGSGRTARDPDLLGPPGHRVRPGRDRLRAGSVLVEDRSTGDRELGRTRFAWSRSMNDRDLPIGVFDSGVGGLTVLHECLVSLPAEDFLYLGDSGHFPYGTKPAEELRERASAIAAELLDRERSQDARDRLQFGYCRGRRRDPGTRR